MTATARFTQPFDPSHIRYNCIGANAWKYQSQWISWEIDVPEDGLYTLGARYRQETYKGLCLIKKADAGRRTALCRG